jgi:hypothetical protein
MAMRVKHLGVRSLSGGELSIDMEKVENVELNKFRDCLLGLSEKEKSVFRLVGVILVGGIRI